LCIFADDAEVDYVLQPSYEKIHLTRSFRAYSKTNAEGIRADKEFSSTHEGVTRILFLGDSMVFGFGVGQDETIPVHLETGLNAEFPGREFEVINLGVPGYDFIKMNAYFDRFIDLNPDVVLIGTNRTDLIGEDTLGCYTTKNLCLARDTAICPFFSDNRVTDSVLDRSRVYHFLARHISNLGSARERALWETHKPFANELVEKIHAMGAVPVIVILPTAEIISNENSLTTGYYSIIQEFGKVNGVKVIDSSPVIIQNQDAPSLYLYADIHPNPNGTKVLGEEIARQLSEVLE
jgi:hypothetical protein